MIQSTHKPLDTPTPGEPVWGITRLYPPQGGWSVAEYLALDTNVIVEYVDRCLEFPPMPSFKHQEIARILFQLLCAAITERGLGKVYFPPSRVRVDRKTFREPDVLCILAKNLPRIREQYAEAADLVVEVVSPDDPTRDLETKRAEYAAAGISEYWIADPRDETLTILVLDEGRDAYREAGRYQAGESATSELIEDLRVEVSSVFADE